MARYSIVDDQHIRNPDGRVVFVGSDPGGPDIRIAGLGIEPGRNGEPWHVLHVRETDETRLMRIVTRYMRPVGA